VYARKTLPPPATGRNARPGTRREAVEQSEKPGAKVAVDSAIALTCTKEG
jgi:hypothetical protein